MEALDRVTAILKDKGVQIWSIAPEATVYEALEVMAGKGVGALPVISSGRLVGLLSERDYARKIILRGRSSRETKVGEVMSAPAITVAPDCSVEEAMRIMTESRVRHLPVVASNGDLLGIISIGDLVKWIITSQEETIKHLHSYIAGN
jgi:CBS domain-containing protein